MMHKIKFQDSPNLKDPNLWESSFIEFLQSCLIKDPKTRPDAETVLKINKKFFALAKNKDYIKEKLLKDMPTVQERVWKYILKFKQFSKLTGYYKDEDLKENSNTNDDYIKWNFEVDENADINNNTTNFTDDNNLKLSSQDVRKSETTHYKLTNSSTNNTNGKDNEKKEKNDKFEKIKKIFADEEV